MAIDLKTLRKGSGSPSRQTLAHDDNKRFVVIVKLQEGAERPTYVSVRTTVSTQFFTSEVSAAELRRRKPTLL